MAALFPELLGESFTRLAIPVRSVHGGGSHHFAGTATVERGKSLVARWLCVVASLPPSLNDVPVTVDIEERADGEAWTRRYGTSAPMRSTLRRQGSQLAERLGPATLTFRLTADDGAIVWTLVRVSALGCPLPLQLFDVAACSKADGHRYRFEVDARLRGIGRIIRYEGILDVAA
jgi:hypothetical protein